MKRETAKKTGPKGTAKAGAEKTEEERLLEERRNEWLPEDYHEPYWSKRGRIWWWKIPGIIGGMDFSFDKKKVYSLFRDYPDKLTPEERKIFEEDCPGLARTSGGNSCRLFFKASVPFCCSPAGVFVAQEFMKSGWPFSASTSCEVALHA